MFWQQPMKGFEIVPEGSLAEGGEREAVGEVSPLTLRPGGPESVAQLLNLSSSFYLFIYSSFNNKII